MSNVNNQKVTLKWNLWEVIKGKTASVLITIFVISTLLVSVTDMIGIRFISIVYTVPSVILGVLTVWIYQNHKNVNKMMVAGVSLEELERREKRFKWHSMFGILIGYVAWLYGISTMDMSRGIFMPLFIMIGFPIVFILVYKPINKLLVKVTHTNEGLIEDFTAGLYNKLLPEDCSSQADKIGILECLEKAEAHTVRGAMYVHRFKKGLKAVGKVGGVFGSIIGVLILLLTLGTVNRFNRSVGNNMRDLF